MTTLESPLEQCLPKELNDLVWTAQVANYVPAADDRIPVFHGETGDQMSAIPAPYSLRLAKKKFTKLISGGLDIQGGTFRVAAKERTLRLYSTANAYQASPPPQTWCLLPLRTAPRTVQPSS